MTNEYNASSIKILSKAEADERFGFALADSMAERYPHLNREFVLSLVEACKWSGDDAEQVTLYYATHKREGVSPSEECREAHQQVLRDRRSKQWRSE